MDLWEGNFAQFRQSTTEPTLHQFNGNRFDQPSGVLAAAITIAPRGHMRYQAILSIPDRVASQHARVHQIIAGLQSTTLSERKLRTRTHISMKAGVVWRWIFASCERKPAPDAEAFVLEGLVDDQGPGRDRWRVVKSSESVLFRTYHHQYKHIGTTKSTLETLLQYPLSWVSVEGHCRPPAQFQQHGPCGGALMPESGAELTHSCRYYGRELDHGASRDQVKFMPRCSLTSCWLIMIMKSSD